MKIIVIGAGIAGLASAFRLRNMGHNVTVLEASERAGGRATMLGRPNTDDYADAGTQYFHSNYVRTLQLINDLGLSDQTIEISGKTKFFTDTQNSFVTTPAMPWMKPGGITGNFSALIYAVKMTAFRRLDVYGVHENDDLDLIPALESTKNTFVRDYIVRLTSIVGGLNEPSVSNVSALQIWRLIRIILMTNYVSLKKGTASLHAALAERLNVRCNARVETLLLEEDDVKGVRLTGGEEVFADHVVVAVEAPAAAKLTPPSWSNEKAFLSSIDMPPMFNVSFFLDRALEKDVWTYMMPLDVDGPVSFCVDTHQKNPDKTPSGKATVQAWILSPASESLVGALDADIIKAAREHVERFIPGFSSFVEGTSITKHKAAVPQSSVGHNKRAREFLGAVDKRPGISFCGDYFSGGYLECALWSVERALDKLEGKTMKNFKHKYDETTADFLTDKRAGVYKRTFPVSRKALFNCFKDGQAWCDWFHLDDLVWHSEEPFTTGVERTITIGKMQILEHFTEWNEGESFTLRFKSGTSSAMKAFSESYSLTDIDENSCELTWIHRMEVKGAAKIIGPLAKAKFKKDCIAAFDRLEDYMRENIEKYS